MLQLCRLDHILTSIFPTEFINSHRTEFISTHRTSFLDVHIRGCFRMCDWAYGLTCRSFGHDLTRCANRFCEFYLTTQHGSTKTPFRSKIRFLHCQRTSSMKEPPWFSGCSTIRLPAATTWFLQLVHNTELQILHVTILKLECRSLESRLSNLLNVCSNVFLRSSVQLLQSICGRNTHGQSTGGTTRVNRQIDSLSQLSVDSIGAKVSTLVGFPLISCLFLDSFPGLPVSFTVHLVSADSTNEETCNLLGGFRQGTTLRSCLCHLCLCPAVSRLPSFGILPSCDHTRHTRNSCLQTSLTCLPCRLSCLSWSWQGCRHPQALLLTHARLVEGTFRSSVSVSQDAGQRIIPCAVVFFQRVCLFC